MTGNLLDAEPKRRLDAITTRWSLIRHAHANGSNAASSVEARKVLVLRYAAAVRNYVGAILRNQEDADELAHEVVVRLLKGDFAGAEPTRGRFRDLLKVAVRNMVRNHFAKKNRRRPVDFDPARLPADDSRDREWLGLWQQSVLKHAWAALREFERAHPGNPAHTMLRLRADYPDASSEELAAKLSAKTGSPVRADAGRQILRRARVHFAELLMEEVRLGLDEDTPERLQEELAALELLEHVRDLVA